MTSEEQARVMETNGMMEAVGWKQIEQKETDDGIYITYMLPKEIKSPEKRFEMGEIPAAQ